VPDTLTPWEGELAVQTIAAVDLGTTSCRAEVFSLDGEPLGRHSVEYSVDTPVPGAAEQDAETWWQAACECLRGALQRAGAEGKDVLAVGFSCQGHSWVPTDAGFRPLRPAFTWLDQRAARQAQSLLDEAGAECWGALAGKTPGPWHMLPQILWMREHEHDVINRAQHLLFVQDFLIARLTGRPATDYTTAAATLFFDITSNAWDGATLDRYRIAMRSLPEVVASGTAVGTVTHDAAAATGLSTETVVVTGAQDQKCAAFGAGLAPGIATASLGTATAIEALMDRPAFDVNVPIPCFPYLQADTWVLEAAITTTGGAVNWLRDALRPVNPQLSHNELADLAAQSPAGCDGVLFFPYLAGAGIPHMRFGASAGFAGITLATRAPHLARAVLEGCAYEIATALQAMRTVGTRVEKLYLFGGGARSELWARIIAAVVVMPLYVCREAETALRGAAMLAAAGVLPADRAATLQDALRSPVERVTVDGDVSARYQSLFERYRRARERYWQFQDSLTQEDES